MTDSEAQEQFDRKIWDLWVECESSVQFPRAYNTYVRDLILTNPVRAPIAIHSLSNSISDLEDKFDRKREQVFKDAAFLADILIEMRLSSGQGERIHPYDLMRVPEPEGMLVAYRDALPLQKAEEGHGDTYSLIHEVFRISTLWEPPEIAIEELDSPYWFSLLSHLFRTAPISRDSLGAFVCLANSVADYISIGNQLHCLRYWIEGLESNKEPWNKLAGESDIGVGWEAGTEKAKRDIVVKFYTIYHSDPNITKSDAMSRLFAWMEQLYYSFGQVRDFTGWTTIDIDKSESLRKNIENNNHFYHQYNKYDS